MARVRHVGHRDHVAADLAGDGGELFERLRVACGHGEPSGGARSRVATRGAPGRNPGARSPPATGCRPRVPRPRSGEVFERAVSRVLCRLAPGDRHRSATAVAGGLQRPTREFDGAGRAVGPLATGPVLLYVAFLRVGLAVPKTSPSSRWALTPPFHPCLIPGPCGSGAIGGLFSVALSLGLRPVGVTHHPALWSPDFPRGLRPAAVLLARTAGSYPGPGAPRPRKVRKSV